MSQPQTFSEWITYYLDLLKQQGRTQAEIARQMGVHPSLLTKWKTDDYGDKPDIDNAQAFADIARLTAPQRATLLRAAGYTVEISTVLDAPDYAAARERYLAALRERYNITQTAGFVEVVAQDEQVGNPRRLTLLGENGVYTPLLLDAPALRRPEAAAPRRRRSAEDELPDGEAQHPLALAEALALPGHLAFIGHAGSGKTTLLQVIASVLAAADPAALAPDLAPALPRSPAPLPIFLPLRLFERACAGAENGAAYTRCPDDLLRFVDDWFARWRPLAALPPDFLADHLRGGRAWLLLDALDEVPEPEHRQTLRNVIHALADQLPGVRLIVTARVLAYGTARLDDRFTVLTVRDLDDAQRAQMVRAIYRGLDVRDAARKADDLTGRIAGSGELQELTRTPVMVWTAAVVHALRGELPDSRAALYAAYVDILLKHSFKQSDEDAASVTALTDGQGWPLSERREYLTYAAFEVHRRLETQHERRAEPLVYIGERELSDDILATYFQENLGWKAAEARQRARSFVGLMVERSGLLYQSDQGYTLGDHLTMQEFLAGCYLGEHYRDLADDLPAMARSPWWRETLLLAAGYLAQERGSEARSFLLKLASAARPEDPAGPLAALSVAARGLLQLRARLRRPSWYTGLAQDFARRLYSQLNAASVDAPIPARQEAGLTLSLLYGMPGQEDGLTDPRFTGPLGLPAFVSIPAGTFWMGDNDSKESDERPRHQVTLDAYEIAAYPTTNAMYQHFVAAGGYANADWWAEAMADDYWKDGKVKDWLDDQWYDRPRYWDNPKWNTPAQPVVGVTWYEATAYCRWLTAALHDGFTYRLPTEAEWERAARPPSFPPAGGDERGVRYPWGNEWREGHCNSKEAGLEMTSPVGLFPAGAAHGAIHDMVGNVYEWCGDWYGETYYAQSQGARNPTGPEKGRSRVRRGGSWGVEGPSRCRGGSRNGPSPLGQVQQRRFSLRPNLSSETLSLGPCSLSFVL
ncbi:MAG TPA: SUMF1/EgtB/PvdO family nonheme iron enzyme [Anaerolineae bacterium]|nr:SUMF1/EgtB/PvdO family nonheme iron enzyme [Anaerolineae bacterium]